MSQPSAVELTQDSSEPEERLVDSKLVNELVDKYHTFIWRLLSRLGIPEADVDDATQQVFMVLSQRQDLVLKVGSERSFLFGVALKVAHTQKRTLARRREVDSDTVDEPHDERPSIESLADQRRARELLDKILEAMPLDMRIVFVLFELDDLQTSEIATLLDIPVGTAASRLRRAREWFTERVGRLQTRMLEDGGSDE